GYLQRSRTRDFKEGKIRNSGYSEKGLTHKGMTKDEFNKIADLLYFRSVCNFIFLPFFLNFFKRKK
ncbi:MAG: hypothetical protein MRZ59_09345, partial [Clostridiales bacterium]|nr:hypothetical protein [Clostridiales bacterium]